MALQLPVLDDRSFDQILTEAKQRIAVHTPEWTNFEGESDPGITFVELFAFLTDSMLYRANRVPELNRMKFLQLLGVPLMPAAAAQGIITIANDRGPIEPIALDAGVVVAAGSASFLTQDGVTVLPAEAQVYYKKPVPVDDPRYAEFAARYEAVRLALDVAALGSDGTSTPPLVDLQFYEPTLMSAPTPATPNPVIDLAQDTLDGALYVAILAPRNVSTADARQAIANEVLSIGIAPALDDTVPPLPARRTNPPRKPLPRFLYEIPQVGPDTTHAAYTRLTEIEAPDVLNQVGVVQLQLPEADRIQTWQLSDPLQEGVDEFPPMVEDDQIRARIVTWVRIRLAPAAADPTSRMSRLTWVGINAARVVQAVPVVSESIGSGTGEPDQTLTLANRPVLPESVRLVVETVTGSGELWRRTDDLFAAGPDDPVFAVDPEAGIIHFGDGLRGARPAPGRRIFASYHYGGGVAGNVAIGAIKASPDVRLSACKISNPLSAWGGDVAETVTEGERNLPLVIRHRDRLVTAQDFHDVTMRTPGADVGRTEVLALFRPDAPTEEAAGVVTVMVVPRFDALRPRWPQPDRLFLRAVCAHLDERRLITTEVYVRGPVYRDVYITLGLQVQTGYFPDVVRQSVQRRLYEYLSSLPPGGPDATGWPLGKPLIKKDLEAVATRVPGVDFVRSMHLSVLLGEDVDEYRLAGLELPLLKAISVVEGEAEPLTSVVVGGSTTGMPAPAARPVPVPVIRTKC